MLRYIIASGNIRNLRNTHYLYEPREMTSYLMPRELASAYMNITTNTHTHISDKLTKIYRIYFPRKISVEYAMSDKQNNTVYTCVKTCQAIGNKLPLKRN